MRMQVLAIATVMMTSAFVSLAQARSGDGVMATFNAYMYNSTAEATTGGATSKSETKNSVYDIKLGYLATNGLYLGGIYTIRNSDNGTTSDDGKNLGASVGYVGSSGFFVQGHYIFSAEFGDLKEGTGIQGDFGYLTTVTSSFMVGVELTYRTLEYKKSDSNAALDKYKQDELFPMLTVGFVF